MFEITLEGIAVYKESMMNVICGNQKGLFDASN